jgi:hypothetical protein
MLRQTKITMSEAGSSADSTIDGVVGRPITKRMRMRARQMMQILK